jgi:hypothetical protein
LDPYDDEPPALDVLDVPDDPDPADPDLADPDPPDPDPPDSDSDDPDLLRGGGVLAASGPVVNVGPLDEESPFFSFFSCRLSRMRPGSVLSRPTTTPSANVTMRTSAVDPSVLKKRKSTTIGSSF